MPQQQTRNPEPGGQLDWWAPTPVIPPEPAAVPESVLVPEPVFAPQPLLAPEPVPASEPVPGPSSIEVYRAVQRSAAFQRIRHSYRTFVFPVSGVFLAWYLLYVAAQAAAPALMRTPVAGPVNVAWLLGLLQFATTFVLAWLYARNARTKRDRAALSLRWDTQDQLR
ncbi:DUF485 domain-containing protein [Kitasatospora sp. NPDC004723]|uniref:DUF485 domain-containing protein n=1 Tax=Kitasatospora sp. NPDC004723 TaxID=3154288 RepID=UPI0033AD25A9